MTGDDADFRRELEAFRNDPEFAAFLDVPAPVVSAPDGSGDSPIGALVWRPALRSRESLAYLTVRSWRAATKPADLDAFKRAKRAKQAAILSACADETAALLRSMFGPLPGFAVTSVACGHSCDPACFGKCLARRTADALGLPFYQAFRDRFLRGASHPKEFRRLPPLVFAERPTGRPTLLVDDLATSGFHLWEAGSQLRATGATTVAVAWLGGTVSNID